MDEPERVRTPLRAMHSILDPAQVGELARRDFGLTPSEALRLLQSGFNDHYALTTPDGAFVVRVYRRGWRSADDVIGELELVDHLMGQGAPVAACVRRPEGGWSSEVRAPEGLRRVAVFRHAPGPYTHFGPTGRSRVSPDLCAGEFGRSVAEIHAGADSFRPTATRFELDLDHLLARPLGSIAAAFPRRASDLERLKALAGRLSAVVDGRRRCLDWGPCHGDVSGGNSTFWQGRVIHFDFDCAGPGWRAYDLGVFLWSASINGHGAALWERFLRGYRSVRALADDDLALVPVFAAIRVVWLLGLFCANAHLLGHARLHDDYLDRELYRLTELTRLATGDGPVG